MKMLICVNTNTLCVKLQILEYISQEDRDVPLLLLGSPGCGKSCILCQAVMATLAKVDEGRLVVPG